MRVLYKILYKSGYEDIIEQFATVEEIAEFNTLVSEGMRNDKEGVHTLGDGTSEGYFIRAGDITRVSIEILEE
jgi:hypothetical protein